MKLFHRGCVRSETRLPIISIYSTLFQEERFMRKSWTCRMLALGLALGGLASIPSSQTVAKDPLPPGTSAKLIAAEVENIQLGLEKMPLTKGGIKGMKSASMLLALNAQNNMEGADAAKMAGLRDSALKVAAALEAGKVGDAKTAAKTLSAPAAGDAKKMVKLADQNKFSLDEAMSLLSSSRAGGLNIENDLKDRDVEKTMKDPKKVELYAARMALIGQYSLDLPPGDANGAKKKKWEDWSKEMTQLSNDLAVEAAKAKPDTAAMKKKIGLLNKNCADCHNEFRK